MQIFSFLGYAFGYLLWLCYYLTANYGLSIILFTIILRIVLFPFSVIQQKSMSKTARLAGKQAELKKKYGNDNQKLNEEMAKLYEKEGANPMGGCLTSIMPMLLMFGIYAAVLNPLTNTLHINGDSVHQATALLSQIPGIGSSFSGNYGEIEIVQNFSFLKDSLASIFNTTDLQNIDMFSSGFNFLGLNLLGTPRSSSFFDFLWLIPVLCFLSSIATTYFTQKITGNNQMMQGQQQGCMKWSLYFLPLVSVWFAYIAPAAVGFYWIISSLLIFAQTVIINMFYGTGLVMAKEEAARIALCDIEEKNVKQIRVYASACEMSATNKNKNISKGKKKIKQTS